MHRGFPVFFLGSYVECDRMLLKIESCRANSSLQYKTSVRSVSLAIQFLLQFYEDSHPVHILGAYLENVPASLSIDLSKTFRIKKIDPVSTSSKKFKKSVPLRFLKLFVQPVPSNHQRLLHQFPEILTH